METFLENERQEARRVSTNNTRTLYGISASRAAVKLASGRRETAKELSGIGVTGIGAAMSAVTRLPEAPWRPRAIIKGANGAPGLVLDAAELYTAKDRKRALAGIVGAAVGSMGGGALGGLAGPVGMVGGSMAGSYAGQRAGEYLYDHRQEIKDRVLRDFADSVTHGWGSSSNDAQVRRAFLGPLR